MASQNNQSELINKYRLRITGAWDAMAPDLQKKFNDREILRSLALTLSTLESNAVRFSAFELATRTGQTIEPVPITFKKAAIILSMRQSIGPDDLDIVTELSQMLDEAPEVIADWEKLYHQAQIELDVLLGSSQDLRLFLEWYLNQEPDITLTSGDGYEHTVSRWRPYRYAEQPVGLHPSTQNHIREFEWGMMEVVNQVFPSVYANADKDAIQESLYILKAVAAWIWLQVIESADGKRAMAQHLPHRAGTVLNTILWADEYLNDSVSVAIATLNDITVANILGVYFSSEAHGFKCESSKYVEFLLQCDYSLPINDQKLLLQFDPNPEHALKGKTRDVARAIQTRVISATRSLIEQDPNLIQSNQLAAAFMSTSTVNKHREFDLPKIIKLAESSGIPEATLPLPLSEFPSRLSGKVIGLCDALMNVCGIHSGEFQVIDNDRDPAGVLTLYSYEESCLEDPSSRSPIRGFTRQKTKTIKRIDQLIGAIMHDEGVMTNQDPRNPQFSDDCDSALEEYPFAITHGNLKIHGPIQNSEWHTKAHTTINKL